MSLKIDDCVLINGGKSKGYEGVITGLNNVFIMVRFTKDKKHTPLFADVSKKVKRAYISVIEPPAIEMPKDTDLKHVDTFDEPNKDIFEMIDDKIASKVSYKDPIQEVVEEVVEVIKEDTITPPYMVNENNVKEPAITIDDAINYRNDNQKLTFKMDAMCMFQDKACQEIGDLKFEIKELKEQLADSCRLDKIEELKILINSI
tara:strand:- start:857 stop:1465 length:609 start_codon:yes stop_codon:yes gene_type:complete